MYFTIISVCTVDENQPVMNFQSRTKSLDRREMKPLKANKGKEKDMLIEQVWTTCAIIVCIIIENSCCTILWLLIYYCYTHTHTHNGGMIRHAEYFCNGLSVIMSDKFDTKICKNERNAI